MGTTRLEAFSDGVIAIIITIMVLELRVPHGITLDVLRPLFPVFLSYVLSFVNLGIYWNNHHHMLTVTQHVDGAILWANLHLLFWLSLVPFVTGWMGENSFAPLPTAAYGVVMLMSGVAYLILQRCILKREGAQSVLAHAVGNDLKGKLSALGYAVAIPAAFVSPWIAGALYVGVALMWLAPDRRIERVVVTGVVALCAMSLQACHPHGAQPFASVPLFDGNSMNAFDVFVRGHPLNADPDGVFRVEGGVIHVSGKEHGYFITKQPYREYRLRAEFKWGEGTYGDREGKARDSGILYDVQGPDKVWPRSIELQIQEGATGDLWMTDGGAVTGRNGVRVTGPPGRALNIDRIGKGTWQNVIGFRDPNGEVEKAHGEWNVVELIVQGDTVKHYVNGKLVNVATDPFPREGKILFQSEGAELYFRNIVLFPLSPRGPTASAPSSIRSAADELPRTSQQLLDAVTAGDTIPWAYRLLPDAVITDENGQQRGRTEFLAELQPLPPAVTGQLRVANAIVRQLGTTGVITYDALEAARYYGQPMTTRFHTTDTYVWNDGRWRLLASHTQVLPSERSAGAWVPDSAALASYVGRYQIVPGTEYAVRIERGRLLAQRGQRPAEELLPSSPDVFVRKGAPRGERVFVRDTNGRVVRMLDRRDNNDIVWLRIL